MSAIPLTSWMFRPANDGKGGNYLSRNVIIANLRNTTTFTESLIAEMLQSSLPGVVPDFDVTVTNRHADRYRGKCYPYGCGLRREDPDKPLIIARVTADDNAFPTWTIEKAASETDHEPSRERLTGEDGRRIRWRGYIGTLLRDREECLLYVLAHELKHLKQRDCKTGWIWGSRGKRYSERDADAFAIRVVRAWRREKALSETEVALQRAASFLFALLIVQVAALAQKRRVDFTA
jgi:hypothetical protein